MKLAIYSKWEKSRDKSFLAMLDSTVSAELIDLGCGDGKFSKKVKEETGNETIFGADFSNKALEKAKKEGIIVEKVDLDTKYLSKRKHLM